MVLTASFYLLQVEHVGWYIITPLIVAVRALLLHLPVSKANSVDECLMPRISEVWPGLYKTISE